MKEEFQTIKFISVLDILYIMLRLYLLNQIFAGRFIQKYLSVAVLFKWLTNLVTGLHTKIRQEVKSSKDNKARYGYKCND